MARRAWVVPKFENWVVKRSWLGEEACGVLAWLLLQDNTDFLLQSGGFLLFQNQSSSVCYAAGLAWIVQNPGVWTVTQPTVIDWLVQNPGHWTVIEPSIQCACNN